jgi:hypothetical protein
MNAPDTKPTTAKEAERDSALKDAKWWIDKYEQSHRLSDLDAAVFRLRVAFECARSLELAT